MPIWKMFFHSSETNAGRHHLAAQPAGGFWVVWQILREVCKKRGRVVWVLQVRPSEAAQRKGGRWIALFSQDTVGEVMLSQLSLFNPGGRKGCPRSQRDGTVPGRKPVLSCLPLELSHHCSRGDSPQPKPRVFAPKRRSTLFEHYFTFQWS